MTSEEIDIRELNIGENYDIVSGMMAGLHGSEKDLFAKTANWTEIEKDYMSHVKTMQEECDGCFLVAFEKERPVGFIFGYLEEQDESRIEAYYGPQLYVSDGYVSPEYRKRGIYRKLNYVLEQKYIAKGIRRIIRFTLSNNEPMKRFLGMEGYEPTRILFEKWL